MFFAGFIAKSAHGIDVLAATMLLAATGFPFHVKPGHIKPHLIFNLGLIYVPLLLGLYLISLAFIACYRISRDTHGQNLRKLAGSSAPRRRTRDFAADSTGFNTCHRACDDPKSRFFPVPP